MMKLNYWEYQGAIKSLYSKCTEEVCDKHDITRMELDILLFLANYPQYDTARDIIEIRYMAKSQVSVSVKALEACGFITKEYAKDNRKVAHLKICERASGIISDGRAAQKKFIEILTNGLSDEEVQVTRRCLAHIFKNINQHMRDEENMEG